MALEPKKQIDVQQYAVDGDDERQERDGNVPFATATHKGGSPFAHLRWWMVEIAASVLSVVLLVVLVWLLHKFDGRATSNLGLPPHLTLNAIISLLSTFMKSLLMVPVAAAVAQELWIYFASEAEKENCSSELRDVNLFDSASRGALGAFLFLLRFKGRRTVASLGAIITIGSLAFSTFTQNLVLYSARVPIPSKMLGLAPTGLSTNSYYTDGVGNLNEGGATPSPETITAFYTGVLATHDVNPISGICPSGDCTWNTTSTLGIGGGCVPAAVRATHCYDNCVNQTTTNPVTNNTCPPPVLNMCDYTLATGSVATLWNFNLPSTSAYGYVPGFVSITGTNGSFYSTQASKHLYVANFDLFGVPYLPPFGDDASHQKWQPSGYECALWINVQSFNATTKESRYSQSALIATDLQGLQVNDGMNSNLTFPQLPPNLNPTRQPFVVDRDSAEVLSAYLKDTLNGSVGVDVNSYDYSSDVTKAIWFATQDVDSWMNNLTIAMTNGFRSISNEEAHDSATGYELGVRVRWAWIAYPAALVGLSIILLVAVIVRTALSPVQAWKGSPLTFLLLDVDRDVRSTARRRSDTTGGLESAAGTSILRLRDISNANWQFQPFDLFSS